MTLHRLSSVALCVLTCVVVAACRTDSHTSAPSSGEDQVLRHSVRLDETRVDTLTMRLSTDKPNATDSLVVGKPVGLAILGNNVYIADRANPFVVVADLDLRITSRLGRSGAGPGEFSDIVGIGSARDSLLVVYDASRIQVIDTAGGFVGQLAATSSFFFGMNDAAGKWIFSFAGRADNPDNNIVAAYSSSAPFDRISSILPATEAQYLHPAGYRVAADPTGTVVYAHEATVPAVEVYDSDLTHTDQLLFTGPVVDAYDSDAVGAGSPGGGQAHFLNFLAAPCPDLLVVSRLGTAYFIRRTLTGFDLAGKLVFVTGADDSTPLAVSSLRMHGNRVYIASWFEGAVLAADVPDELSCKSA